MTILIVDDCAANRKLLRVQLEAEGFSILEAVDGIEALEVLVREPFNAVISDILMPRMDGYRLCHEVRSHAALRELRFILYSSTYTSTADVRLCATVGADQFIAKPAPLAVILAALQISALDRTPAPAAIPNEAIILQQYSSVLVAKLQEKNTELMQALEVSRVAHRRIQELNVGLEDRVRERTAELVIANGELTAALGEVRQLNCLLPICSFCKSIRDGKDYWESVESYITNHTNSQFSHGVCPTCYEKHYAPQLKKIRLQAVAVKNGKTPRLVPKVLLS